MNNPNQNGQQNQQNQKPGTQPTNTFPNNKPMAPKPVVVQSRNTVTPAMAPSSSPVMQIVAAFVVGILVGVVGYTLVNKSPSVGDALNTVGTASSTSLFGSTNTTAPTTPETSITTASSASTDNSVVVANQAAGKTVTLSQIDLKDGGWVAIQQDNGGVAGAILGASYFAAGQTLNGSVSLLQPTVAGMSYLAVVHFDTGLTPRSFNYRTDVAMDDSSGHPIATAFAAQ